MFFFFRKLFDLTYFLSPLSFDHCFSALLSLSQSVSARFSFLLFFSLFWHHDRRLVAICCYYSCCCQSQRTANNNNSNNNNWTTNQKRNKTKQKPQKKGKRTGKRNTMLPACLILASKLAILSKQLEFWLLFLSFGNTESLPLTRCGTYCTHTRTTTHKHCFINTPI